MIGCSHENTLLQAHHRLTGLHHLPNACPLSAASPAFNKSIHGCNVANHQAPAQAGGDAHAATAPEAEPAVASRSRPPGHDCDRSCADGGWCRPVQWAEGALSHRTPHGGLRTSAPAIARATSRVYMQIVQYYVSLGHCCITAWQAACAAPYRRGSQRCAHCVRAWAGRGVLHARGVVVKR